MFIWSSSLGYKRINPDDSSEISKQGRSLNFQIKESAGELIQEMYWLQYWLINEQVTTQTWGRDEGTGKLNHAPICLADLWTCLTTEIISFTAFINPRNIYLDLEYKVLANNNDDPLAGDKRYVTTLNCAQSLIESVSVNLGECQMTQLDTNYQESTHKHWHH